MAKSKKGSAKKEGAKPKAEKRARAEAAGEAAEKKEVPAIDLDALRKPVEEAKTGLDAAEAEQLTEKAHALVAGARETYRTALVPYREACRKADHACEFEGGRGENVSDKVSFLVEKMEKGVRVTVKGKPDTEEVIPLAALKESINKAAYGYTEKHLGPKEKIGNKGGSLSNRLRAVLG
jgi:hypothetical protein